MQRWRNRRRAASPLILLIVVAGGLLLTQSNHYHNGVPKPGDLPPQTPVVSGAAAVAVEIRNFDFSPRELTVRTGAAVTWTNQDVPPHDATEEDDSWSTGMLRRGESETIVFDAPGAYRYFCTIHPTMRATVTVM